MYRETDFRDTEAKLPRPQDPTENIRRALQRGLPEFSPSLFPHDGTMIVCGSGPSLPSFTRDIAKEREKRRPIMAIKGAHDLLCENGLEPDLFVSCEARPRLENVRKKNQRTVYLLSSRCAPELFDWLSDCKIVMWHSYSDKEPPLPELLDKQVIGGGTTSGLRGVTIGYTLGFSKFVLYGFDSCMTKGLKRYDATGPMPKELTVDRWVYGRRFLCNGAMAMQADEFQQYYKILPEVSFDVKGDGLIAAIVADRKRRGLQA